MIDLCDFETSFKKFPIFRTSASPFAVSGLERSVPSREVVSASPCLAIIIFISYRELTENDS